MMSILSMQIINLLDVILGLLLQVTQLFTHAIFVFGLLLKINGFRQIWPSICRGGIPLLPIHFQLPILRIKCLNILHNFFPMMLLKLIHLVLIFHLFSIQLLLSLSVSCVQLLNVALELRSFRL